MIDLFVKSLGLGLSLESIEFRLHLCPEAGESLVSSMALAVSRHFRPLHAQLSASVAHAFMHIGRCSKSGVGKLFGAEGRMSSKGTCCGPDR